MAQAGQAFILIADMEAALGDTLKEILNVSPATDISANVNLISAIDDANDVASDYIRNRYTLNIPTVSTALKGAIINIARFKLKSLLRPESISDADAELNTLGMDYLKDISAGKIALDFPIPEAGGTQIRPVEKVIGSNILVKPQSITSQEFFDRW